MRIRATAALFFILLGITLAVVLLPPGDSDAEATWTMVNVSGNKHTGDSHLLELADGKVAVIDTGYRYYAEHKLVPLLQNKGITMLDALVITHAHRNHYGGISELLKAGILPAEVYFNLPPEEICAAETWATGCDFEHVKATLALLEEHGVPVRSMSRNTNILSSEDGTTSLDVLYVFDGIDTPVGKTDINDTSTILKLTVGKHSVLFTADLNKKIGSYLAEHGENLVADIMTAPHHGVESAAPNDFFDLVDPDVILASVSTPPHASYRGKRLRDYAGEREIPLYVSGLHGNVVVKFHAGGYRVIPARKPEEVNHPSKPAISLSVTHTGILEHPAHVMRIDDHYIAAELYNDRLVVSETGGFSNPAYIDKAITRTTLRSPHFISRSVQDGILFSEGWGNAIINIPDAVNPVIARYSGPQDKPFRAPHGVCQAQDGWIYVADSLNSRLVRFRQEDVPRYEVFADHGRLVGYGRQILCREDGIWLSNSYERKEGINPGEGSNVLRITDFASGQAEVMVKFKRANMTGIGVIDDRWLLTGLWSDTNQTLLVDLHGKEKMSRLPRSESIPGPPYGIEVDEEKSEIYISYPGDIFDKTNQGGYAVYSYSLN